MDHATFMEQVSISTLSVGARRHHDRRREFPQSRLGTRGLGLRGHFRPSSSSLELWPPGTGHPKPHRLREPQTEIPRRRLPMHLLLPSGLRWTRGRNESAKTFVTCFATRMSATSHRTHDAVNLDLDLDQRISLSLHARLCVGYSETHAPGEHQRRPALPVPWTTDRPSSSSLERGDT